MQEANKDYHNQDHLDHIAVFFYRPAQEANQE